ncbi:hypothetical protein [Niabella aquatica]
MATVLFPVYVERGCSPDVHQQTVVASIAGKDIIPETKTLNQSATYENYPGLWVYNAQFRRFSTNAEKTGSLYISY